MSPRPYPQLDINLKHPADSSAAIRTHSIYGITLQSIHIYDRLGPVWTIALYWLVHLGVLPYGSQKRVPHSGMSLSQTLRAFSVLSCCQGSGLMSYSLPMILARCAYEIAPVLSSTYITSLFPVSVWHVRSETWVVHETSPWPIPER